MKIDKKHSKVEDEIPVRFKIPTYNNIKK